MGEFRAKKYFTDHRTSNTTQLFFAIEGTFSGLFFSEQIVPNGNSVEVLDECSYLFIC